MDSISIDVKVISGKDLKAFNFFQKLTIYAQVSISSNDPDKKLDPNQKQQQRTPTDKEGDGNPEWNYQMRFDLNKDSDDNLFLHFQLFHEGVMFGDKTIGEVRVPVKDLIQDFDGIVRFVRYQVRSSDDKPNGILDFSFKVNREKTEVGSDSAAMAGFPAAHNHLHHHHHQPPSAQTLYPQVEVDHGSPTPPIVYYPSPEPSVASHSSPQLYPPSTGSQHSFQEDYYPPPENYYPLPPPPPLMHQLQTPPPPPPPHPAPMLHGAYYHSPHPHGLHHWGPSPYLGAYDHSTQGTQRPGSGQLESWTSGWRGLGNHHSSSWNGRCRGIRDHPAPKLRLQTRDSGS